MTTIKVLYNERYGGFCFSDAFLAEYKARTGKSIPSFADTEIGPTSIRCDPVAIAIFEERGAKWSSGQSATLEIYEFPAVFANYWTIDEYDGMEKVQIDSGQAFADVLHNFMKTRDMAALEHQYAVLKKAKKYC